jgi:hypothetical protein
MQLEHRSRAGQQPKEILKETRALVLSVESHTRAIWAALLDKGLVTPSEREHYLDAGYLDLLNQLEKAEPRNIILP